MAPGVAERLVSLRWVIVGGWSALAVGLAILTPVPDPAANELQTFLPDSAPSVIASGELARHFPHSAGLSQAVIVIERRRPAPMTASSAPAVEGQPSRPGITGADLSALDELSGRVRRTLSAQFAGVPGKGPIGLPAEVVSVRSPGDLAALGKANPLLSPDGQAAVAVVQIPANFVTIRAARAVEQIRRLAERTPLPEGLELAVTGSAAFGADYAEATRRSYDKTLWATVTAVLAVLLVVYRAPLAAGAVLGTISLAAVVAHFALHIAAHAGLHVGMGERIFVFVLLYGLGVDYSLLYLSRFREFLQTAPAPAPAAAMALSATATTILASSGTDIAGLAMLSAASFKIFQTTGKAVPIALAVVLAAGLTLVPAVAGIVGGRLFWPGKALGYFGSRRVWPALARVVTARPGVVLAAGLAMLALPAVRAVGLNFAYDTLTALRADYGAARGRQMAGRHWPAGQATPTMLLLRARSEAAASELVPAARRLTEALSQTEGVADVRSLSQPVGRRGRDTLTELLLAAAGEKVRREYLTPDGRAGRLEIILSDPGFSNAAMAALQRIQRLCRRDLPTGLEAHLAGATPEMLDVRAVTTRDFRLVAALVLAAVFVIVVALLRDVALSAFMVGSLVASYLAALGTTGWIFGGPAGAGVDWKVQVLLFVVMLAVGVDYNIFLAARMREESRRANLRDAVRAAMVKTGGIISSAGLIMIATLGSLVVGEIALLLQLGVAFAVGMALDAFVVRPLLLPAFAVLVGRLRRRR